MRSTNSAASSPPPSAAPETADAAALIELGRRQIDTGDDATAIMTLERAAALTPARAEAYCNLAVARHRLGYPEKAAEACEAALQLDPGHAETRLNFACILRELGRLAEADAHATLALVACAAAGRSDLVPDALFNRGLARLGLGHSTHGWADFQARLFQPRWRYFDRAQIWDGSALAGRRLALRREQGLGDELVFGSQIPALLRAARGGTVVVECDARLAPAYRRAFSPAEIHPIDVVAARAGRAAATPAAGDLWLPVGSLPLALNRDVTALGADVPHLAPAPGVAEKWRRRLAEHGEGPFIGVCWRSSLASGRRDRYQAPLRSLAPLWQMKARFVPLQIGLTREEIDAIAALSAKPPIVFGDLDMADDIENVLGLAAALDAVVSVSTWITPLAGALGRPVFYFCPIADYWTLGTDRMPWLPSVRSFDASGERWTEAAEKATGVLRQHIGSVP